ncbi:hypothetical protein ACFOGJ_08900 [Marinibaculum pumilum]|uniref:Uncharacterized protein n=1 Tax=Marinibaculum pumilum TaxID=1766165 RepID=A0ABV7KYF7_9PROT
MLHPRPFAGQRVFVIGGGASIDPADLPRLPRPIVAVNAAYVDRPDADVLFWIDHRFYRQHRDGMARHTGRKVARGDLPERPPYRVEIVGRTQPRGPKKVRPLSHDPRRVGGFCSGAGALNRAYLDGAAEIVLLGFDMGGGDYHDRHRVPPAEWQYETLFAKHFEAFAPELAARGVKVWNTSLQSRLDCFEKRPLREFL